MHGQMLAAKADHVSIKWDTDSAAATADYNLPANGHWFSDNDLKVTVALDRDTVTAMVTATDRGDRPEPVGIGWHPIFSCPLEFEPTREFVPAPMRVEVNDHDDLFPTGKGARIGNAVRLQCHGRWDRFPMRWSTIRLWT